MSFPTSWLIEDRRVIFDDCVIDYPDIRQGLNEGLYRQLSAAELYGILRSFGHGYIHICFESPAAVYMCLVTRNSGRRAYTTYTKEWFSIPWENYEWFCYRYLSNDPVIENRKLDRELDWRQVGF